MWLLLVSITCIFVWYFFKDVAKCNLNVPFGMSACLIDKMASNG